MILTRLPLYLRTEVRFRVRLACIRHAASVDSEPGSNSQVENEYLQTPSRVPVGKAFNTRAEMALALFSVSVRLILGRDCVHVLSSFQRASASRASFLASLRPASPLGEPSQVIDLLDSCQTLGALERHFPRKSSVAFVTWPQAELGQPGVFPPAGRMGRAEEKHAKSGRRPDPRRSSRFLGRSAGWRRHLTGQTHSRRSPG